MATTQDVAEWMAATLERDRELYQEDAVAEIENRFGAEFIYTNETGGESISRQVLKEFRELTENTVVWQRREKLWRKREPGDEPNRLQPS